MFMGPLPLLGFEGVVLFAIKTTLILFTESGTAASYDLFVEVGCIIVVNWIINSSQRPWRWWPILAEIDQYIIDINKAVSCRATLPSNGMVVRNPWQALKRNPSSCRQNWMLIGLKMMAEMGFVQGMGLGKDSQGITNPLVATRLPKSQRLGANR
ncbi:hypothetical protein V6N13_039096 [Hibiscus sabdariffa]